MFYSVNKFCYDFKHLFNKFEYILVFLPISIISSVQVCQIGTCVKRFQFEWFDGKISILLHLLLL